MTTFTQLELGVAPDFLFVWFWKALKKKKKNDGKASSFSLLGSGLQ